MKTPTTFLDCPAYVDEHGAARCGLPAEIQVRYTMQSSDGPLESAKIRCPSGHLFNGPIEFLTWNKSSPASLGRDYPSFISFASATGTADASRHRPGSQPSRGRAAGVIMPHPALSPGRVAGGRQVAASQRGWPAHRFAPGLEHRGDPGRDGA
jgi:hypothetical protein